MADDKLVKPHPKAVGDATTAMVLARLVQAGKMVLLPFSENQRYDLLIEETDGSFIRVQCKSGRMRNGAVNFSTCSTSYHHPNNRGARHYRHDYRGEADVFGVYCRQTEAVYLVPVHLVGKVEAALRVDLPRNNQTKKVRWAKDYDLRAPG